MHKRTSAEAPGGIPEVLYHSPCSNGALNIGLVVARPAAPVLMALHCVNGESGSSLLIESTDSMIYHRSIGGGVFLAT